MCCSNCSRSQKRRVTPLLRSIPKAECWHWARCEPSPWNERLLCLLWETAVCSALYVNSICWKVKIKNGARNIRAFSQTCFTVLSKWCLDYEKVERILMSTIIAGLAAVRTQILVLYLADLAVFFCRAAEHVHFLNMYYSGYAEAIRKWRRCSFFTTTFDSLSYIIQAKRLESLSHTTAAK